MMTETQTGRREFIPFLKSEFAERCEKNPAYSLRAFAKLVGTSHSTLSQVMSGKRPLTEKMKKRIAMSMGVSHQEFIRENMRDKTSFEEKFRLSPLTQAEGLSDWYYDAILELTNLKYFKPDGRWIAKVLGLGVPQVEIAVEKLIQAGLLEINKKGQWVDLSGTNTNNYVGDYSSQALRKYQKDILLKSMDALENIPRSDRDHTSLMLSFSKDNMKSVKEFIKKFRSEFLTYGEEKGADDVYTLSISFFPVSNSK